MAFNISGVAKRNISIIMLVLLTVVFCGSIDLKCDHFTPGGSIRGTGSISVSHSLIAFPSAAVRGNNNGVTGNDQNFDNKNVISDLFSRVGKKLLAILGCIPVLGELSHPKVFFITICIAGCAFLFLLIQVRFIHLKDGCK